MGSSRKDRQTRQRRGPAPAHTTAKQRPPPQEVPPQPESVRKVFATAELLEEILLQVDQRSLLTSVQRVCASWHDFISSSPSLQRHLFFLAPAAPATSLHPAADAKPETEFVPNPLLRAAFPCLYPDRGMHPAWQENAGIVPPGAGFVAAASAPEGRDAWGRWVVDPDEVLPMTDARHGGARNLAFTRRGASWRRMLVSRPPPRRVARVGLTLDCELQWRLVEFPAGLRMGELFDEVFTMNWSRRRRCVARRCSYNCHGEPAQIAWRVPAELVVPWGFPETFLGVRVRPLPGQPPERTPPPGWVASVDLVLGEDSWTRRRGHVGFCMHPLAWDGMGPRCFLWQHGDRDTPHTCWWLRPRPRPVGGMGMKWLYQCQEYKPGGPLSLPPLDRSKRR